MLKLIVLHIFLHICKNKKQNITLQVTSAISSAQTKFLCLGVSHAESKIAP